MTPTARGACGVPGFTNPGVGAAGHGHSWPMDTFPPRHEPVKFGGQLPPADWVMRDDERAGLRQLWRGERPVLGLVPLNGLISLMGLAKDAPVWTFSAFLDLRWYLPTICGTKHGTNGW